MDNASAVLLSLASAAKYLFFARHESAGSTGRIGETDLLGCDKDLAEAHGLRVWAVHAYGVRTRGAPVTEVKRTQNGTVGSAE